MSLFSWLRRSGIAAPASTRTNPETVNTIGSVTGAFAAETAQPKVSVFGAAAEHEADIESAINAIQHAARLEPLNADIHARMGRLLRLQQRVEEAIDAFQLAMQLDPNVPEWRMELATMLVTAGRLDEAVAAHQAPHQVERDARAYCDLGHALLVTRRFTEAEQALRRAASLAPESGGIQFYLAVACRDQDRLIDAEDAARKATEVAPDMPQGWFALGSTLTRQGRHEEAVEHFRQAIELMPEYEAARDGLLCAMNYSEHWSAREISDAHFEWGQRFPPCERASSFSTRSSKRRIRVGYLSPDFRQHPVSYFIEPVLRHHDKERFEVFCYHSDVREDQTTAGLEGLVKNWRRLGGAADAELEDALREDCLDILVELSGHTDGHRLPVLARRVAPIQVTYLGYPNTTGLQAMDYRITDAHADPPGESDHLHIERLVRLQNTFLCYSSPEPSSCSPVAPFRRKGHVTFCSFNNFRKISPTCIKLWAGVLTSVPNSKLLIKTFGLQDPHLRNSLIRRFERAGVHANRVSIAAPIHNHRDHMAAYEEADVALDTFPYNGTTTTLDALWMGVPVVTLAGDRHASRVGLSILSTVGLFECIAKTPEEYVAAAVGLAGNVDRLDLLHRSLRERLQHSPLMDGRRFTADLEEAYLQMRDQY